MKAREGFDARAALSGDSLISISDNVFSAISGNTSLFSKDFN
jgi:hypothetical protein